MGCGNRVLQVDWTLRELLPERSSGVDFDTESHPERENRPSQEANGQRDLSGDASTAEFSYTDPVQSFLDTVTGVVTRPVVFFGGMARRGDFLNPLLFVLVSAEIFALSGGVSGLIYALISPEQAFLGALLSLVLFAVFLPIVIAVVVFVNAAIYHLVAYLLVKPETSGFEATFRVLAYSSGVALLPVAAAALFGWVPVLGAILSIAVAFAATAYLLFLTVVGVREAHETTTGRAVLVMLIPVVVSFLGFLLLLAAGVGAVFFFVR